jgi:alternative sigma factor RpoH
MVGMPERPSCAALMAGPDCRSVPMIPRGSRRNHEAILIQWDEEDRAYDARQDRPAFYVHLDACRHGGMTELEEGHCGSPRDGRKREALRMRDAMLTSEARTRYFDEIRRFPMLKAEKEYALAVRWRGRADESAAHQLLTSHLHLVAKVALRYRNYGVPISDLISEGNIGLMQAVKRFDPDKGIRFSTYAIWWIRASIQNYILRSWSLVKMGTTFNQRKLFFNLPKAKRRLSALEGGDLRPDQVTLIANGLGVREKEVVEMNRRVSGDVSLNVPLNEHGDSVEWQDRLVDEGSDQESCVSRTRSWKHAGRCCAWRSRYSTTANAKSSKGAASSIRRSRLRSSRPSFPSRANGSGRSKIALFKKCGGRCMGQCRGNSIL